MRLATSTLDHPAARRVARPAAQRNAVYEARLSKNLGWALGEGQEYFQGRGAVHDALRRIAHKLDELGIPYAVGGALALFAHGYRRFTEDVDLLVTPEGLKRIQHELVGLGYARQFPGSKGLRDTHAGVRLDFIVTGQFPGDGKPKPVCFPAPDDVAVVLHGIRFVGLHKLIELKLASGTSSPQRLRDLADVLELVKALELPVSTAERLDQSVRGKFIELWKAGRSEEGPEA